MIRKNLFNFVLYVLEVVIYCSINSIVSLNEIGILKIVFRLVWLVICFMSSLKIKNLKSDSITFTVNILLVLYISITGHVNMLLFVPLLICLCRILAVYYVAKTQKNISGQL